MGKERKYLNIGLSLVAFSSATLAACGSEENPATDSSATVVEPGECEEVIDNNILVCNVELLDADKKGIALIGRRAGNGLWERLDGSGLEVSEEKEFSGVLDGMSMFLDAYKNIHVKVEEPLLSATPIPKQTPLPTPFRYEPQPVEGGTA